MTERETNRGKTPSLGLWFALGVIGAGIAVVFGTARFGNPDHMPLEMKKLAEEMNNPRAFRETVVPEWALLCQAWQGWLGHLEKEAPRLLQTETLWTGPNDMLHRALANFVGTAKHLRPETLVPEAAVQKDLRVLAESPPEAVRKELLKHHVADAVTNGWTEINALRVGLERWYGWDEMRSLLELMRARGFTRSAAALGPRVPVVPTSPGYRLNASRTLRLFNDLSRDEAGTRLLLGRWREFTRLAAAIRAGGDPELKPIPGRLLERLTDQPSLAEFAKSLDAPLEEMRRLGPRISPLESLRAASTPESTANSKTLVPVGKP